jgi:hypothetical protein
LKYKNIIFKYFENREHSCAPNLLPIHNWINNYVTLVRTSCSISLRPDACQEVLPRQPFLLPRQHGLPRLITSVHMLPAALLNLPLFCCQGILRCKRFMTIIYSVHCPFFQLKRRFRFHKVTKKEREGTI